MTMRTKYVLFLTAAGCAFSLAVLPGRPMAATLTVDQACADSTCYTTIQAAISAAAADDSIAVEPGTYHGQITLSIPVSLTGRETARTILDGDGGTIITVNGVTSKKTISGFTFQNAVVGIEVANNSSLNIVNNVFTTGLTSGNIGVRVQNTSPSLVELGNNTFYQNSTAVSSSAVMAIQNNIFANNTIAISSTDSTTTYITYNCFYNNTSNGQTGDSTHNVTSDPQFVSPADLDFHLKEGSLCIDAGNPDSASNDSIDGTINDMGAYGGPGSDTIPFPVDFTPAPTGSGDSITVSWTENLSSVVTSTNPAKQGGYRIHYSLNKSGAAYDNHLSLASTEATTVISGLTSTASAPAAPVVNPLGFDNQALLVSWPPVSGATGYNVYYLVTGTTNTQTIPGIQDTSYTIEGLVNGTQYTVWVTAIAQSVYYLAVTAFDYTVAPTGGTPGVSRESDYSPEARVTLGSAVESAPSNTVTEYPEAYSYNPNLPNKGCFIATAAYGYYDAPQVQALRDFRDRYLETNSAGRVFVIWYYKYGPLGAAALNEHPWLKPVARTALLPAVGGALFLTRTSPVTQLLVLFLFGLIIAALVMYKKNVRRGGSR